jgi:hypothetical protein
MAEFARSVDGVSSMVKDDNIVSTSTKPIQIKGTSTIQHDILGKSPYPERSSNISKSPTISVAFV